MERKTNEKILRKDRGITLVALIITIIVMIILAGITLNLSLGSNGIFSKIQQAKVAQERAQVQEDIELAWAEVQMDDITGTTPNKAEAMEEILEEKYPGVVVTEETEIIEVVISDKGIIGQINKQNSEVVVIADGEEGNDDGVESTIFTCEDSEDGYYAITGVKTDYFGTYGVVGSGDSYDPEMVANNSTSFFENGELKSSMDTGWGTQTISRTENEYSNWKFIDPEGTHQLSTKTAYERQDGNWYYLYIRDYNAINLTNTWGTINNTLDYYATNSYNVAKVDLTIPNKVEGIDVGHVNLEYFVNLNSLTLPITIQKLGYNGFEKCGNLKEIKFKGTTAPEFESSWYPTYWNGDLGESVCPIERILIPSGSRSSYEAALQVNTPEFINKLVEY